MHGERNTRLIMLPSSGMLRIALVCPVAMCTQITPGIGRDASRLVLWSVVGFEPDAPTPDPQSSPVAPTKDPKFKSANYRLCTTKPRVKIFKSGILRGLSECTATTLASFNLNHEALRRLQASPHPSPKSPKPQPSLQPGTLSQQPETH